MKFVVHANVPQRLWFALGHCDLNSRSVNLRQLHIHCTLPKRRPLRGHLELRPNVIPIYRRTLQTRKNNKGQIRNTTEIQKIKSSAGIIPIIRKNIVSYFESRSLRVPTISTVGQSSFKIHKGRSRKAVWVSSNCGKGHSFGWSGIIWRSLAELICITLLKKRGKIK